MNRFRITSSLLSVAMIATLAMKSEKAQAEINILGVCTKCPSCDCALEAKMVDVEKSCFEVETKTICIPKVVFPWQRKKACGSCDSCDGQGCNTCINNGATTRCIRVIKKKKYTCPECKYSWSHKGSGGCDNGCDAGCAKAESVKQPVMKVVNNEVALPAWLEKTAIQTGTRELRTTELEPVQIETRKSWSSFNR